MLALAQVAHGPEVVWTALDQHCITEAVATLEETMATHQSLLGSEAGATMVRSSGRAC